MRRRLAAALVLAAVPLAGCGGGSAGSGVTGTGLRPPTVPPRLVVLERTGGIAGTRESVRVEPDGRWEHVGARGAFTGTLPADQRDRLTRLGADPDFAAEATRPGGSSACADGYEVSVAVAFTTVRWSECGPGGDAPPVAAEIARLLDDSTE